MPQNHHRAGYARAGAAGRELLVLKQERSRVQYRAGSGDASGFIRGYAAVYYRAGDPTTEYWLWDDEVERIMPGAFDRVLSEQQDVRGLFNHNPDNLLGRVSSGSNRLTVDETGLRYELTEDPSDPDWQRVARKIDRGDLTGSSFAFIPRSVAWVKEDDLWIRQIQDVDVFDVGPVTFPAYEGTSAGRSAEYESLRTERDQYLRERANQAAAHDEVAVRMRVVEVCGG